MDEEWTLVEDHLPDVGQKVFYYFDLVGVWPGEYYGLGDDFPYPCFGGETGWLTGDVTHWMPRSEGDTLPGKPE